MRSNKRLRDTQHHATIIKTQQDSMVEYDTGLLSIDYSNKQGLVHNKIGHFVNRETKVMLYDTK